MSEVPNWLMKPPSYIPKAIDRSPEVTDNTEGLICWWCVHDLPKLPCYHLPVRYDEPRQRFQTIGNFCSWSCAKAYAIDMKSARWGEIQSNLAIMRFRAYGKYVPMFAAPKREALKKFGGVMTIEEFRACSKETPPPVYFPNDVQLHQIIGSHNELLVGPAPGKVTSVSGSRMKAIENSESKGDSLKLKRNKPLERSKSKLESTLGIIRKVNTK